MSMHTSTGEHEFVGVRALCQSDTRCEKTHLFGEDVRVSAWAWHIYMCETSTTAVQTNNPPIASNMPSQPTRRVRCVNPLAPGGLIYSLLLLYVVPVRVLLTLTSAIMLLFSVLRSWGWSTIFFFIMKIIPFIVKYILLSITRESAVFGMNG